MEVGGFDLICFDFFSLFFCRFRIYCMMHINKPIVFLFFFLFSSFRNHTLGQLEQVNHSFFKTFPPFFFVFILAFCKLSHDRLIFKFTFGWWNLILEPIGSRPRKR